MTTAQLATAPQTAPPPPAPLALSGRKKAAIVVKWLIAEGTDFSLASLPIEVQLSLTEALADIPSIDKATLQAVAAEFASDLEQLALSGAGGPDGVLTLLDGKISDVAATAFRNRIGSGVEADPWDRLKIADEDELLPLLEQESVEVSAVLLSKLPVKTAAALLGRLPGPRARRITYAVSQTSAVTPSAVARIGAALLHQIEDRPVQAFDGDPVDRIGAILNSSRASTRDEVLGALTETDADFATRVRRAIFTFANIPTRLDPGDVPALLRDVAPQILVTAMIGAQAGREADAAATDFLLENLPQRMADQLRDQMEEMGKVSETDGEAAMMEVVDAIRSLAAKGDITLIDDSAQKNS
ncbi:flagellar motor switch protein FliG [Aestuariibius insulae]|uniref:flagellar motor switch protein FliG n=1 Tax=Aestuariibius insulae TaxID=2058287 RepID=UPI00345E52C0